MLDSNSALQPCAYCIWNSEIKKHPIQVMRPKNSDFDSLYCNILLELNSEVDEENSLPISVRHDAKNYLVA